MNENQHVDQQLTKKMKSTENQLVDQQLDNMLNYGNLVDQHLINMLNLR